MDRWSLKRETVREKVSCSLSLASSINLSLPLSLFSPGPLSAVWSERDLARLRWDVHGAAGPPPGALGCPPFTSRLPGKQANH